MSLYCAYLFLVKSIPKFCILFYAIISGIVFLISLYSVVVCISLIPTAAANTHTHTHTHAHTHPFNNKY